MPTSKKTKQKKTSIHTDVQSSLANMGFVEACSAYIVFLGKNKPLVTCLLGSSGKQMRASSAPPTCRYFQQDCRGGASCWSGDSCPQSGGVLELEGGVLSTSDETLTGSDGNYAAVSWSATTGSQLLNQGARPQFGDGMPSQDMLGQPVECEPPTQGASLVPARLVNKFTPISPTKYK